MSDRSFRKPRRRGLDEDVFARRPRGFASPAPRRQPPSGPPTRATVKWFSPEKGFGFVVLDGGRGDALLHASVLEQSGHDAAALQAGVGQGQRARKWTRSSKSTRAPPSLLQNRRSVSGLLPGRMIAGLTA